MFLQSLYHKVNILDAKVVGGAELEQKYDLTEGYEALSGKHAPKLCLVRLKISLIQL
jgi:hypothetical protein